MIILNSLRLRRPARQEDEEPNRLPEREESSVPEKQPPAMPEPAVSVPPVPVRETEFVQHSGEETAVSDAPQTSAFFEKICSALEVIAGTLEECSRKLEPGDENDLKFN